MSFITGVGLTSYGRHEGSSSLDLMSQAAELAIADAGLQRADVDHRARLGRNHLLAAERMALEFFRRGITILYRQLDLCPGRNIQGFRLKLMVLNHQSEFIIGGKCTLGRKDQRSKKHDKSFMKHGVNPNLWLGCT